MSFIWYILIGILSGFIAGKIMRGGGFGIIINLLVGIIGGLITSVAGAILLLWIVSLFNNPHKTDI